MRATSRVFRAILLLFTLPSIGLFLLVHLYQDEPVSSEQSAHHHQVKRRVLEKESSGQVFQESHNFPLTNNISIVARHQPQPNVSSVSSQVTTLACDEECKRFQSLLASWPSSKPKAAIYILTRSIRWDALTKALASLDQYFNNQFRYPIIIFHENEFNKRRDEVRQLTRSDVYFQSITFSIPKFLDEPVPVKIPCTSSISYRHMCRFHAKTVYELPIMQDLLYYWRLDDDSVLLSNVSYDVFQHMDKNQLQYGYIWRHLDAHDCVRGLWEGTRKYIDAKDLATYSFDTWKEPWLYYNNFEISATRTWFTKAYQDYIEYIDRLGGIYYHRWGDAPIRGIAVSMFIPKSQVHYFKDIGYQHGSFVHVAADAKT